ncbi:MAG: Ser-Thr-rich GPI-anchored membrane family protein [Synechococcales bacterium]|nr:Ser-Thr-rich GPI-anchored membrane family protein [Synechococcales bacterium]
MSIDQVGNSLSSATLISVPKGSFQGTWSERVDGLDLNDYYQFSLSGRSSLSVGAHALSGNIRLNLLTQSGALLQSSDNPSTISELITSTLEAGTYYLQVSPSETLAGGDYQILFETRSNPQPDLIWRHNLYGANTTWQMNGGTIAGSSDLLTVADGNWQIAGVGDFNADGHTDYLWRHNLWGANVIWQMQGNTIAATHTLMTVDTGWQIHLAADLNNDGKSDIFWQHHTGLNVVWYMDGGTLISTDSLLTISDRNWKLEAAGDFNADGKTDLAWRNYATGDNVIWGMNGKNIIAELRPLAVRDVNWQLVGAGDFNGDGKSDFVWRHSTGANVVWQMDRGSIIGQMTLMNVADPNWKVVGIGTRFAAPNPTDLPGSSASSAFNLGDFSRLDSNLGNGTVSLRDRLGGSDSEDYYRFTLNASSVVNFNLSNLSADANLQLLTESVIFQGVPLPPGTIATSNNTGTTSETITRTLGAGTYYIRVFQGGGETGYSLGISAAPAKLQVTNPNLNQTVQPGTNLNLTWTDNLPEDVKLELFQDNTLVTTIATSIPSAGNYAWLIPNTLAAASNYRIKISSTVQSAVFDFSDQSFAIAPTLQFTAPGVNQSLRAGVNYSLTWQDSLSENVKLDLYKDGQFYTTIISSTASDGEYSWMPGETFLVGSGYQIRIASVNNNSTFAWSNAFSIAPAIYKYQFTHFYNGQNNTADYYTGWVYGEKGKYSVGSWLDPYSSNNDMAVNGRYQITAGQWDVNAAATQLGQVFVDRYYDQEVQRNYAPRLFSQNRASGANYLGSESDSIDLGIGTAANQYNDFGNDRFSFDTWVDAIEQQYQLHAAKLGQPTGANYGKAATSAWGTQGYYRVYTSTSQNDGSINWSTKAGAITTLKEMAGFYHSIGGSGSWLGFALKNQVAWGSGVRQDFEGGYLYFDGQTTRGYRYDEAPVFKYNFTYYYNGNDTTADYYTGWVYGDEGKYAAGSWIDPITTPNETGLNGRYRIHSATYFGNSKDVGAERGKVLIDRYYDVDSSNQSYATHNFTRNLASGTNFLGAESDYINGYFGDADYDLKGEAGEFDALPDLRGKTFDVVQTQLFAGNQVQINFSVDNLHRMRVNPFQVSFYLSSDTSFTSSDYLLGSGEISGLGGAITSNLFSISFSLPDTMHSFWKGNGTYYIGVLIDSSNAIVETLESNNSHQGKELDWDSLNVTLDWFEGNLQDTEVKLAARSRYTDGLLDRNDMISILREAKDNSIVDAIEISDFNKLLNHYFTLNNDTVSKQYEYVHNLTHKIVNGDLANARYQGFGLGNLQAGSSADHLEKLIAKWFLGSDRPDSRSEPDGNNLSVVYGYERVSGSLFQNGISYQDIRQGGVGDCYFLAGLAAVALRLPSAIENMFIDNQDDTWTVRFYRHDTGKSEYVTVDRYLPVNPQGRELWNLPYAKVGGVYTNLGNELWVALAEKAYVQLNESGWSRPYIDAPRTNAYQSISNGNSGFAVRHITNLVTSYGGRDWSQLIDGFNRGGMVLFGSYEARDLIYAGMKQVVPTHVYTMVDYNPVTQKIKLFNPWGNIGTQAHYYDWDMDKIPEPGEEMPVFLEMTAQEVSRAFRDGILQTLS